eukprot:TRINITY_DN2164_c0_g3_i1.p1 TRINITY_DN2164_c0_g3~~TRINITY_DN2164_c0_g3_i1.p1  ORF type:complete len:4904 (+),score=1149.02 TRINITY_DN2164_c0_g3_i1:1908-14714(+)
MAGGVGLFGTQTQHPLLEASELATTEPYPPLEIEPNQGQSRRRAYVYVRLPRYPGSYEVCYSAREQRAEWSLRNGSLQSIPMWFKAYPCASEGCAVPSPATTSPGFTLAAESYGWTMLDLTPGTYGTIRIDAGNASTGVPAEVLNRRPVTTLDENPRLRNYWRTEGGDQLRVVHRRYVTESFTLRGLSTLTDFGSSPLAGCWYRANDRAWEDGSDMPTQCRDFGGDPTLPASTRGDDLANQHDAFCSVYVPRKAYLGEFPSYLADSGQQEWFVCYRRAGVASWRMLPWHDSSDGVPRKWTYLEHHYTPATEWSITADWGPASLEGRRLRASTPIVPGIYGDDVMRSRQNFTVLWEMNDTRRGTWGPLAVATDPNDDLLGAARLSSLPWDYHREYAQGARVVDSQGSAVRLVRPSHGCDDPDATAIGAESLDGGRAECSNARAGTTCLGSSYDGDTESRVWYYLSIPDCNNDPDTPAAAASAPGCASAPCNLCNTPGSGASQCMCLWRVCWRAGGFNWRVIGPATSDPQRADSTWDVVTVAHTRNRTYADFTLSDNSWRTVTWTLHEVGPGYQSVYYGSNTARMMLRAEAPSTLAILSAERRSSTEALFVIFDPLARLSVGPRPNCTTGQPCEDSFDVFRLVPNGSRCDITPARWASQAAIADVHLSLHCPVQGAGRADLSGLSNAAPCSSDPFADSLCGGHHCHVSPNRSLLSLLYESRRGQYAGVPEVYDDIVPFDSTFFSVGSVAASVVLPAAAGLYQQCYKQAHSQNWITQWANYSANVNGVLAEASVAEDVIEVTSAALPVVTPTGQLLSGEIVRFELTADSSDDIDGPFRAKLVARSTDDNDGCTNPQSGTEANPFASATSVANRTGPLQLEFHLTVPHTMGAHWLCMQTGRSSLAWLRYGPYTVVDPGVRWFVTAWDQPTNQGIARVSMIRCVTQQDGRCDPGASLETWNTDPGRDAAKIVNWWDHCHAGDVPQLGESLSVSLVDKGDAKRTGTTDLGPADGPADVAEFPIALPSVINDTRARYKVCAYSKFEIVGRRAWVEVLEATGIEGQVLQIDPRNGEKLHFTTRPSGVRHWTLDGLLQLNDTFGLDGVVSVAGASTMALTGVETATPGARSVFHVSSVDPISADGVISSTNHLKLVKIREPVARYPPPPGDGTGWEWQDIAGADCSSPGIDGTLTAPASSCADRGQDNDSVSCPRLVTTLGESVVHVEIQLPSDPGFYYVCYRTITAVSTAEPWLWLTNETGGTGIYLVPSHLEFDAGTASTANPVTDGLRLYDVRIYQGVPLSSWCATTPGGGGMNCSLPSTRGVNTTSDWVAVVNATHVCPAEPSPASATFSDGSQYYKLTRNSNTTARTTDSLRLPPNVVSSNERYRVCVMKVVGSAEQGGILRAGVVYSAWNRAEVSAQTLGQSPFWAPAAETSVTQLLVTPDVVYNSTVQFLVYKGTETRDQYQQIEQSVLGALSPGLLSNTPVVRSGSVVRVLVEAGAAGSGLPFGSFPVEVQFCPQATSWDGVACDRAASASRSASPQQAQPFQVTNALGGCTAASGPTYGWGSAGLRQFLNGGSVTFRLQYRSKCPAATALHSFGCGLRFVGESEGRTLISDPMWLNVAWHHPDAVALDYDSDGAVQRIDSRMPGTQRDAEACRAVGLPECYVKVCRSHSQCSVLIMALYAGPREFAANGTLNVGYSTLDYGGTDRALAVMQPLFADGPRQFLDRDWTSQGDYTVSLTPKLRDGVSVGHMFYNITYGEGMWTRFVIEVIRPQPSRLILREVFPLDTGSGGISVTARRSPVPVWHMQEDPLSRGGPLTAQQGSYLESLVPYELRYEVEGVLQGQPVVLTAAAAELDGWVISAAIDDVDPAVNTVLAVDGGDTPDATRSLQTAPRYTRPLTAAACVAAEGNEWSLQFRVRSGFGCARAQSGSAPGGYGCAIRFALARVGEAASAALSQTLTTPVRTEADTLRVHLSVTNAPVQEGIMVTAMPGVVETFRGGSRFLADEFHYGDVFALMSEPSPTSSGIANRDGVRFTDSSGSEPGYHRMGLVVHPVLGTVWGAQWTMRTTKPCVMCTATFHSTWGAGPVRAGGVLDGVRTFTLSDRTTGVECSPSTKTPVTVVYQEGNPDTTVFAVTVTAADLDGPTPTIWPRWWVFTDTAHDLTLRDSSEKPAGIRLEQRGPDGTRRSGIISARQGEGGVASIPNLYLRRGTTDPASTFPNSVDVRFHAIAQRYNTSTPGAVATGQLTLTCTARVTVVRDELAAAPRLLRVVNSEVTGADELCGGADDCREWRADLTDSPVVFTLQMYADLETGTIANTSDANVTVRVVTPVDWTCPGEECVTGLVTLASPYSPIQSTTGDGREYSFGGAGVTFGRSRISARAGKAEIELRRVTGANTPVRAAQFEVCPTVMVGTSEIIDASAQCAAIRYWAYPKQTLPRRAAILSDSTLQVGGSLHPGSATCGNASLVAFTALVYFELAGQFYVAYAESYDLSLTNSALDQYVVTAENATEVGRVFTRGTALRPGAASHLRISHSLPVNVTFQFYGLVPTSVDSRVEITGVDADTDAAIQVVRSTNDFRWAYRSEQYESFVVLDVPDQDDYCTPRRRFTTTADGYLGYQPWPAVGWGYGGGAGYSGATVGQPFPVSTRVLTNGNDLTSRAWSFPDSLVLASRLAATKCNSGGELVVMRPTQGGDELPGSLAMSGTTIVQQNSFESLAAGGALTHRGQVTLWPKFSAPCESCVLEIRLCYRAATSAPSPSGACLSTGTDAERPIFPTRTQVTKAFSVTYPSATNVRIINQILPEAREGGFVYVGMRFTIVHEAAQVHGNLALRVDDQIAAGTRLVAHSVFAGTADAFAAEKMRYGNGGFLSSAQETTECEVRPRELSAATVNRWGASVTGPSDLHFWFSRPCLSCEVHFSYTLASGATGQFRMRRYYNNSDLLPEAGDPAQFAVRTCGIRWQLGGPPPVQTFRRQPFSVTVWLVDQNGIPSWQAGEDAVQVLAVNSQEFGGNGAGGSITVSSPLVPNLELPKVRARQGSATVRLEWTRACYRCAVAVESQTVVHSVFTDPTQIIAIPQSTVSSATLGSPSQMFNAEYHVFAADELGDRSYGTGGPTSLLDMARYRQHDTDGVSVSALPYTAPVALAYLEDGSEITVEYSSSEATAVVRNGSLAFDGVPYGARVSQPGSSLTEGTPPGTLVVGLQGHHHHLPVRLAFAGLPDLPTHLLGTRQPPQLSLSLPSSIWVTDFSPTAPKDLNAGDAFVVRVWAVGTSAGKYYATSLPVEHRIGASIDCASAAVPEPRCVGCTFAMAASSDKLPQERAAEWWRPGSGWTEDELYGDTLDPTAAATASFARGTLSFAIRLQQGSTDGSIANCRLSLSVTPVMVNAAAEYSLTIRAAPTVLETWAWETYSGGVRLGDVTADAAAAEAVVGRNTVLRQVLWDKRLARGSRLIRGPPISVGSVLLQTSPEGCFVPRGTPSPSPEQNALDWHGSFTTPGNCYVDSVSGLPTGQAPPPALTIVVTRSVGVELVPFVDITGETSNFTGLPGRTLEGDRAAHTGVPVELRFRVFSDDLSTSTGDDSTEVTVNGERRCPGGVQSGSAVSFAATAKRGNIVAVFVPSVSTRRDDGIICPYWFNAQSRATGPDGSTAVAVGGVITEIGPLFVTRRASELLVEYRPFFGDFPVSVSDAGVWRNLTVTGDQCGGSCAGGVGSGEADDFADPSKLYVAGWPMLLRLRLRDVYGAKPRSEEDAGFSVLFHWRPLLVPCGTADVAAFEDGSYKRGCYDGGTCELPEKRSCGFGDWHMGRGDNSTSGTFVIPTEASAPGEAQIGNEADPARRYGWLPAARAFVTATHFTSDADAPQQVWLANFVHQRPSTLVLEGGVCSAEGQIEKCTLPSPFRNVDALRSALDRRRLQGVLRIAPLTGFSMRLQLADSARNTVAGDVASTVVLTATCHSGAAATWSMGRITGFLGDQFLSGEVSVQLRHGVASFDSIGFPENCANASLTARIVSLPEFIDPLKLNEAVRPVVSAWFEVYADAQPAPTPLPEVFRQYPTGIYKLKQGVVDLTSFPVDAFEAGLLADLNKKMAAANRAPVDNVVLELVCNIPDSRVERSQMPITDADRGNPSICKRFNDTVRRTTPQADSCPCTPVIEFRVEANNSGITSENVFAALQDIAGDPSAAATQLLGLTADSFVAVAGLPTPAPSPVPPGSGTPTPPDDISPADDGTTASPQVPVSNSPFDISAGSVATAPPAAALLLCAAAVSLWQL